MRPDRIGVWSNVTGTEGSFLYADLRMNTGHEGSILERASCKIVLKKKAVKLETFETMIN